MKKIFIAFVCLCCMLISCSKDDSEQELKFAPNELVQTVWSGCQYYYNDNDEITYTIDNFKIDFQNESMAYYIDSTDYFDFDYKLVNRRLWCSSGISGYWTLTEKSKNRMVLETYTPKKSVLILTRIL